MSQVSLVKGDRFELIADYLNGWQSPSLIILWEKAAAIRIPISEIATEPRFGFSLPVVEVQVSRLVKIRYQFWNIKVEPVKGIADELFGAIVAFSITEYAKDSDEEVTIVDWEIQVVGSQTAEWIWEKTEIGENRSPVGEPRILPETTARKHDELLKRVRKVLENSDRYPFN